MLQIRPLARGCVWVSFGHPIADFGHPNIHICVYKEVDTQLTPNVCFGAPNSEILAKALTCSLYVCLNMM